VATSQDAKPGVVSRGTTRIIAQALACGLAVCVTVGSAIIAKEFSSSAMPLAAVDTLNLNGERVNPAVEIVPVSTNVAEEPATAEEADEAAPVDAPELKFAGDAEVRWFDGRPARPARQYWMTVTGYSPDERSCPGTADGLTATLHSVQTNNMKLVAADTSLLPYGSMLSIPGYDDQQIVPVLDCGGAIKGRRLDLLFPTHEAARKWGRQRLLVTVWEYCDGKPAENPRKLR